MTSSQLTARQRARILARLQSHGTTHCNEWRDGGRAVDGGPEIKRVAARILELREPRYGGHKIVKAGTTPERCRLYRLVDVRHVPSAKPLAQFREWRSIVRCFNCHTVWPPGYDGECCGEDRLLLSFRIVPPTERPLQPAATSPNHIPEAA